MKYLLPLLLLLAVPAGAVETTSEATVGVCFITYNHTLNNREVEQAIRMFLIWRGKKQEKVTSIEAYEPSHTGGQFVRFAVGKTDRSRIQIIVKQPCK